ncbi:MAG: hypothetical protein WCJ72_03345 [Chryseobacterium sp.]
MSKSNKTPPEYSEKMIIGLIRDTKKIEDLVSLGELINDLESQKDLVITEKIRREIRLQQETIIYGGDLLDNKPI